MGAATEAMETYFRCVHSRDSDGLRALFAPDARVTTYWGLVLEGNETIGRWLEDYSFKTDPSCMKPKVEAPIEAGNRCVVEFDVQTEDGPNRLVNIFTVDEEGRVTDFIAYRAFGAEDASVEPGWVSRRRVAA